MKKLRTRKRGVSDENETKKANICANSKCKLRKAGCTGFEGCPGYMSG